MVLSCGNSMIKTRLMQIRRGIFQGDSLSPLLFCMAVNPLSEELNRTGYGYRMTTGHGETAKRHLISHLLTCCMAETLISWMGCCTRFVPSLMTSR